MPEVRSSHRVRDEVEALRARLALLRPHGASAEVRRLQFDAVRTLVEAQRGLVAMHAELLANLKAAGRVHDQQRIESIELAMGCDALHDLVREIERAMHAIERSR